MNNDEIRKANRKAMPRFILIMVISAIIGGGVGFFAAKYGMDVLAGDIKSKSCLLPGMVKMKRYLTRWMKNFPS